MKDEDKTKGQLIQELAELRRQVEELQTTRRQVDAESELALGIAKELSDLMTIVIGYAELLQMDPAIPESAKTELAYIVDQGLRGSRLVRQILYFTQAAAHQPQPMDLAYFVIEAVPFVKRALPENMHVVVESHAEALPVQIDVAQLQQMLVHLAVNARDAMPNGGELGLSLSRLSLKPGEEPPCPDLPPGEWGVLSVSDTGVGIPAEILPRIFEPFFTTKGAGQGIGLGLAQVRGILEQHNGYIDVASQAGQGTSFTIYLPLQEVDRAPEEATEVIPRGSSQSILLVEDESQVLRVSQALLKRLGYQVLTAVDGKQALEVYDARQGEIDLVLTDVVMPNLDGPGLFRALREKDPEIKVVMMSGYLLKGQEAERLLAQGVADWLQKPLEFTELAQVVSRALE